MFSKIKAWWNKGEIERTRQFHDMLDQYSKALEGEREAKKQLEHELTEAKEEVGLFRSKKAEDELRRNGKEPWVEIKSADYSEVKGIQIELDWNDAFIQYLKDNGMKGRDDEIIVQKWLAFLYQDLIEKLEQKLVNNSDKPRVSDYK